MNVLKILLSMIIFGSIGLVVSYIPLPSAAIVVVRALLGAAFIGIVMILRRSPINKTAVKKNLLLLILSGIALAANWVLLFEAYRYVSVSVATLCYYMAPVFVTILSPLVLKERLTVGRILCTAVAVAGATIISGASFKDDLAFKGVLLALGAALLYCTVVLFNKKITRLPAQETTFFQLLVAAVATLPYAIYIGIDSITLSIDWILPLAILGIVHTGVAYLLFFGAAKHLPAQSTAVLSYIDPVTAVLLSCFVMKQYPETWQAVGCGMILIAAFLGEVLAARRKKR